MLATLINKMKSAKENVETKTAEDYKILPPFLATQAIYNDRLRVAKWLLIAVSVAFITLFSFQEYRYQALVKETVNKDFIVIPGAVDFMRIRPGLIPDNTVFLFAEYVTEQMGSFNYLNVEQRHERVAQFMTASFKEAVMLEVKQKLPLYRELNATEIFIPDPVQKYELKKDESGNPIYVVNVEGTVERYSGAQRIQEGKEIATLTFRTTRIMPDKPWMFEIMDMKRQTVKAFKAEQVAKTKFDDSARPQ